MPMVQKEFLFEMASRLENMLNFALETISGFRWLWAVRLRDFAMCVYRGRDEEIQGRLSDPLTPAAPCSFLLKSFGHVLAMQNKKQYL